MSSKDPIVANFQGVQLTFTPDRAMTDEERTAIGRHLLDTARLTYETSIQDAIEALRSARRLRN